MAVLEVHQLVKSYPVRRRKRIWAVDGVDFRAEAGEITAVLGPNGAGKTTTLEICTGLRRADSGQVTVLGRDRLRASGADSAWLRERVGVMVQGGGLPLSATGRRLLRHLTRLYPAPADAAAFTRALGLERALDTPIRRISGGERQRLALACALLGVPELAFLDEPSSGVDPHARRDTWALLRAERERGCGIILTTHHLDEAEELADKVVIVDSGRVVAAGTVAELASGFDLTITWDEEIPGGSAIAAGVVERAGAAHLLSAPVFSYGRVQAILAHSDAAFVAYLAGALAEVGLGAATVTIRRRTLESAYMEHTGRDAITAEVE